jgi:hypothetical protein
MNNALSPRRNVGKSAIRASSAVIALGCASSAASGARGRVDQLPVGDRAMG